MAWLGRLLTENLLLKVASLLLGFVAWAYLARDTTTEILMKVPIEYANVPAGVMISAEPVEVQLLLRGPRPILRRTRADEVHVQVDLRGHGSSGTQMVELTAADAEAPAAVDVLNVTPAQVRITLSPATQ